MKFAVDKNIPLVKEFFGTLGDVTILETGSMTSEAVRDADVLIVRSETKVGKQLLEKSAVKFVGTTTIGFDHIDLDYLNSRHIAFANAPGSNANAVKEYVVAGLLYLSNFYGFELRGKTIGVVGVGNVGKKIIHAAEVLGMHVLKNDPPLARLTADRAFLPLDELAHCDIISLHVPLTKTGMDPTFRLFDGERFGKMKQGSIFINTSRGSVVDTKALIHALREKRIAYSIIDVWENEPAIDQELLSMVTIGTAHIAGHSLEGKINAVRMVREQVCKYFSLSLPAGPDLTAIIGTSIGVQVPSDRLQTAETVLHRIVSQCYDITFDDAQLRGLLYLPLSQRKEYFQKLRSTYRIRREFSNAIAKLPPQYSSIKNQLNSLGLRPENPQDHQ